MPRTTSKTKPVPKSKPLPKTKPSLLSPLDQLRSARLTKMLEQIKKLRFENRRLHGELVPIERIKREVLRANVIVKAQLLALPDRLAPCLMGVTDPRDIRHILRQEIDQALNDLARFGARQEASGETAAERGMVETEE